MGKIKQNLIIEEEEMCYNEYEEPTREEMDRFSNIIDIIDDYEFVDPDLPQEDYITI